MQRYWYYLKLLTVWHTPLGSWLQGSGLPATRWLLPVLLWEYRKIVFALAGMEFYM